MNRQDFYLNLALELNKLKVPPEIINTHIDQFKQYLQTLSEEDAEKQIESFGAVPDLAANIYRLLCGSDEVPAPDESADESVYDAFRVENEDEEPPTQSYAEPVEEEPPEPTSADEDEAELSGENPEREADDNIALDFDVYNPEDYVAPDLALFDDAIPANEPQTIKSDAAEKPKQREKAESKDAAPDEDYLYESERHNLLKENNSALFWILFAVTLPITAPIFITVMALFGFTYLLIALLVASTFLMIFAIAVSGALLALTGGLYGMTQLRAANNAIGLFELGLALVIAGATILLCYIFSLLSFRLLPKLFRYLTKFLRFFLDKLLCLIEKIKKECARK